MPMKIALPDHVTLDETKKDLNSIKTQQSVLVEKIFCSNRHSGILLSNGEFWAAGDCAQAGKANIAVARKESFESQSSQTAASTVNNPQMERDEEFKSIV